MSVIERAIATTAHILIIAAIVVSAVLLGSWAKDVDRLTNPEPTCTATYPDGASLC